MSQVQSGEVAAEPRFGEGPFPSSLRGVNWGAALVGLFWALVHGCWSWLVLMIAVRVGSNGLFGYLHVQGMDRSMVVVLAATFVTSAVDWAVGIAFALKANRLAWEYEARRIASRRPDSSAFGLSIATYTRNQRVWLYAGALALAAGLVLSLFRGGDIPWMPQRTVAAGICAAAALLVLWLYDRRLRQEHLGESS